MASNRPTTGCRRPSRRISIFDVPVIKKRILSGEFLNRIAADYDVNPGRISEIKTGQRFPLIPAAVKRANREAW
jgi:hypothetical protein